MKVIYDYIKKGYASTHKIFTGKDFQDKHMYYALFWLTLLPIFVVSLDGVKLTLVVLAVTSPVYMTPVILNKIWDLWMEYVNLKYIFAPEQAPQLYELQVPSNIQKSPAAMELFLAGLLLTQGTVTEINKTWEGKVRPWWSLEVAGIHGEVKMYIWMWKRFEEHVEAQLYGQFPEVKMVPVEDYAQKVAFDKDKYFIWAHRFKLKEDEALPIKTYYDYGLHENADKWETKVDPIVNMLEKFALAKQGEQMWLQILIQKSDRTVGEEAETMIEKIYKDKTPEYPSMHDPDEKVQGFPMLLPSEREKVDAIQRASKKPVFDVVIRNIYIADKDKMNSLRIQSMGKMFQPYDGFNSLVGFVGDAPAGDYPWQDYTLPNKDDILKDFLAAYKLRSGFHHPYQRFSNTLSTEELATIFHFPSQESEVPGMDKVQAKSASPPVNLPT